MKITLITLLLTGFIYKSTLFAQDLSDQEKIILNEMSKSVGVTLLDLEEEVAPPPSPIPTSAPAKRQDDQQEEAHNADKVEPQEDLNSGKSIVERLKEKNRQAVRERQAKVDAKNLGLEEDDEEENLVKKNQKFRESLKQKVNETRALWKNKIESTRQEWLQKRKEYLKRVNEYKSASFNIEEEIKAQTPQEIKKILERNKKHFELPQASANKSEVKGTPVKTLPVAPFSSKKSPSTNYHLIQGALSLKVYDQGKRPTCASFAGLRALEILLIREAPYKKLSEQYFYYSSKPQCKQSPCAKKGSWVNQGYLASQNSVTPDIPLDSTCPYQATNLPNNQTHIPLSSGCQQGYLKVNNFHVINETEIMSYLNNNYPVVVGVKLNPAFYDNQGFIGLSSSGKSAMDSHAEGHAVVLVGHMKLPKDKIAQEGEYCYIAANSWGEGWGLGGHSCLSQKWIKNNLIKGAITSPISISYL